MKFFEYIVTRLLHFVRLLAADVCRSLYKRDMGRIWPSSVGELTIQGSVPQKLVVCGHDHPYRC